MEKLKTGILKHAFKKGVRNMSQYYCQFCDMFKDNDKSPMHRVKSHDNKEGGYDVCEECFIESRKDMEDYIHSVRFDRL